MQLQREPKNSPTRLLAMAVYFKLKRRFLSEGTQLKTIGKFDVNRKALSKILMGRNYMGGTNRKALVRKRRASEGGEGTSPKK